MSFSANHTVTIYLSQAQEACDYLLTPAPRPDNGDSYTCRGWLLDNVACQQLVDAGDDLWARIESTGAMTITQYRAMAVVQLVRDQMITYAGQHNLPDFNNLPDDFEVAFF